MKSFSIEEISAMVEQAERVQKVTYGLVFKDEKGAVYQWMSQGTHFWIELVSPAPKYKVPAAVLEQFKEIASKCNLTLITVR